MSLRLVSALTKLGAATTVVELPVRVVNCPNSGLGVLLLLPLLLQAASEVASPTAMTAVAILVVVRMNPPGISIRSKVNSWHTPHWVPRWPRLFVTLW